MWWARIFPECRTGVTRADNTFASNGQGQNTFAPRIGFAQRIGPQTNRVVLRGGYGLYFSGPTDGSFSVKPGISPGRAECVQLAD